MKRFSAFVVLTAALVLGYFAAVAYQSALVGAVVTAGICAAGLSYVTGRPLSCLGVDPAGTKTDGTIAFGSQIATVDTVQFIVETGRVTRGSNKLETTNQFGVPNKKVHKKTTAAGSVTLQLPDPATVAPALFATIPLVPIGGGAAVNYLITEVGDEFSADGITKVNLSIEEKLN